VSEKLLSQFSNSKYNLQYYVALEPDSTFGWWNFSYIWVLRDNN
jgi:hypothetical protein